MPSAPSMDPNLFSEVAAAQMAEIELMLLGKCALRDFAGIDVHLADYLQMTMFLLSNAYLHRQKSCR